MRKWLMVLMLFLFSVTGVHAAKLTLLGAGATFPYPLYSKWFNVYYKKTGIKVNYQAIGSGGGIRQLLARTVDFGATDAPMKDSDLAKAPAPILHIPMTLGAVAIGFNVPGVTELKLTPKVLADIFLGKITKWNDPAIQKINDVRLPDLPIIVAHRSDSSGTTYIFTDYLCKVSKEWCEKVGHGKTVKWPVGMGGKGNPGVAAYIKKIPGTIGYIEIAYAIENHIPVAALQNKAGRFIKPTLESISAAANIKNIPDDTRCSITNTDAPNGYPIASFTWIIIYKEQNYNNRSYKRAKELVKLLWWCIHDAQQYNEKLLYGKLPPIVVHKGEKILKSVTYNGKPIL
ncbi:phosphate ABC transporter, periplasmic phosphate-binding protein [Thermodesulfatator indicus DSM 15286]|uniref:Phosphate-binding protein n=1 Tax=Thermodesulfatator indicus (strain DSM 15286 / JCM 11887 / CIR29812) TaxID=667014 RepID=F8ABT9_THEID|nr:phosphate ABC transporter substrate-binding protein PstS [Thermodesulfatator indicus]AEH44545.1 phosphate ABC transporter, periplasmic phosphate-binding protein [Thermodesulfatator indicus DSM 15286]